MNHTVNLFFSILISAIVKAINFSQRFWFICQINDTFDCLTEQLGRCSEFNISLKDVRNGVFAAIKTDTELGVRFVSRSGPTAVTRQTQFGGTKFYVLASCRVKQPLFTRRQNLRWNYLIRLRSGKQYRDSRTVGCYQKIKQFFFT